MTGHNGATLSFVIPVELVASLQVLSRAEQGTLFMTLCAAFNVLLARYSGQSDICIGTPIANRNRSEIEGLIGFFVNTLVLRNQVDLGQSFTGLLRQVRHHTLEAYARQDVPFEQLVEALSPERDTSYTPLFQVMLILQNAPMAMPQLPRLQVELMQSESVSAKFDLTLSLMESEAGLQGIIEYNTDLFDADTIHRMTRHFLRLLEAIAADPACLVGQLTMLAEEERHQVLHQWNATGCITRDSRAQTIQQLFEDQAARTPDRVAVVHEGVEIVYGDLNSRANRLAHHLRGIGVGPDELVGVCTLGPRLSGRTRCRYA
jgi:non-ribosomal peptide synthetase component F